MIIKTLMGRRFSVGLGPGKAFASGASEARGASSGKALSCCRGSVGQRGGPPAARLRRRSRKRRAPEEPPAPSRSRIALSGTPEQAISELKEGAVYSTTFSACKRKPNEQCATRSPDLAADQHDGITDSERMGERTFSSARRQHVARNVILSDEVIHRIVTAAKTISEDFAA